MHVFLCIKADIRSFMSKKLDCCFRLYATCISTVLLVLTAPSWIANYTWIQVYNLFECEKLLEGLVKELDKKRIVQTRNLLNTCQCVYCWCYFYCCQLLAIGKCTGRKWIKRCLTISFRLNGISVAFKF